MDTKQEFRVVLKFSVIAAGAGIAVLALAPIGPGTISTLVFALVVLAIATFSISRARDSARGELDITLRKLAEGFADTIERGPQVVGSVTRAGLPLFDYRVPENTLPGLDAFCLNCTRNPSAHDENEDDDNDDLYDDEDEYGSPHPLRACQCPGFLVCSECGENILKVYKKRRRGGVQRGPSRGLKPNPT